MPTTYDFIPGDIIEQGGECFQVLENLGERGQVRNFPSEEETGFELDWECDGYTSRKIGNAPLPAPSPCATGDACPTYDPRPRSNATNIIARQS